MGLVVKLDFCSPAGRPTKKKIAPTPEMSKCFRISKWFRHFGADPQKKLAQENIHELQEQWVDIDPDKLLGLLHIRKKYLIFNV